MSSSSRKAIQTGNLPKGMLWHSASVLQWGNITWRDFLCSSEILLKVRKLSILPTHRVWHSQIYCVSGIHDISLEFTLDDKESRNMIMKSLYINISLFCAFPYTLSPSRKSIIMWFVSFYSSLNSFQKYFPNRNIISSSL